MAKAVSFAPSTGFSLLESNNSSPKRQPKRLQQYKIGELLGSGRTCDVFAARNRLTREKVALKKVKYEFFAKFSDRIDKEVAIHRTFRHPNIILLHAVCFDKDTAPVLVMEKAKGNIIDVLAGKPVTYIRPVLRLIVYQVLNALHEMHHRGYVHCDVKVENVLLGFDGSFKLADFGFAQAVSDTAIETLNGTPEYMPPECFVDTGDYDEKFDIWSLGILAFVVLLGRFPDELDVESCEEIYEALRNAHERGGLKIQDYAAELLDADMQFLRTMLVVNRRLRPSAQALLNTPWLHNGDMGIPKKKKRNSFKRLRSATRKTFSKGL